MDVNPLTNDDVADILALLDSLPYDELDLETPRFRLTLRRTTDGWTQSTQVLSTPEPLAAPASAAPNRSRSMGCVAHSPRLSGVGAPTPSGRGRDRGWGHTTLSGRGWGWGWGDSEG